MKNVYYHTIMLCTVVIAATSCRKKAPVQTWNEHTKPVFVEFRLVKERSPKTVTLAHLEKVVLLNNSDIKSAIARHKKTSSNISLQMNSKGTKKLAEITKGSIGRRMAIIANGECVMAPKIQDRINGGFVKITGRFTAAEADGIAAGIMKYKHLNKTEMP